MTQPKTIITSMGGDMVSVAEPDNRQMTDVVILLREVIWNLKQADLREVYVQTDIFSTGSITISAKR